MKTTLKTWPIIVILLVSMACQITTSIPKLPTVAAAPTLKPTNAPIPVMPGAANPDEPVFISGEIPYTSPFFLNSSAEPFVMLEDEAGFIQRDIEFIFSLKEQVIGPVEIDPDEKLSYYLSLPAVPQATMTDLDNNGRTDAGVQVFALAYWSNTWGGPFLETRDGKGWSSAYASTITDPERDYEISGGTLIVWAPDDQQAFPTGFGEDNKLFTGDDPTAPIPAGYNIVDLNDTPFRFYKEAQPQIDLIEGAGSVNDYASESYSQAFQDLLNKAGPEYPFTKEKGVNWQQIEANLGPRAADAKTPADFYRVLRDLTRLIPDGHVGVTLNQQVFAADYGGGFGLVLAELSDGRIIATHVLPGSPADNAGIQPGAIISQWDGQPTGQAIAQVEPGFGPYSTDHARRQNQVVFLTRVPPGTNVEVAYQNPGGSPANANLQAVMEYDSLFKSIPAFSEDELALPVASKTLPGSGLGYIRISTFSDDTNLMARLWERAIQSAIDSKVPGLILDLRSNGGGSMGLAMDFAGYFFDKEALLYQNQYFNANTQEFENTPYPTRVEPAPQQYTGPVVVLISADCVSACEGFSYAMQHDGRAIIIGHTPTAGAYGEVGQGQYKLPDDLNMQFPTGRSITPTGDLVIEGVGVTPDIRVPVTAESAMGEVDAVLQQAIETLLEKLP